MVLDQFWNMRSNSGEVVEEQIGTGRPLDGGRALSGVPEIIVMSTSFMDNNNAGKPQNIELMIGRRSTATFGTSTGDQQLLTWTGAGNRASRRMLVHHDDSARKFAYGSAGGLPDIDFGVFTDVLLAEASNRG